MFKLRAGIACGHFSVEDGQGKPRSTAHRSAHCLYDDPLSMVDKLTRYDVHS